MQKCFVQSRNDFQWHPFTFRVVINFYILAVKMFSESKVFLSTYSTNYKHFRKPGLFSSSDPLDSFGELIV